MSKKDADNTPKKRGRRKGQSGRCSYCGQEGHYKKTCPKYKAEVAEDSNLVEVNLKVGMDPDDK